MGAKLSKKKSCDLPNTELSTGIQEPENKKIEHEVQNAPLDVECNTGNMSTQKLLAEKTAYQKNEPEASKDENQTTKHKDHTEEKVKDDTSTGSRKTEALIEVETNKTVQQSEEPSGQSTGKQTEPLKEKNSSQMEEDSNRKSDLPKGEGKLSANVLELTKEVEVKTSPVDLDANPDTYNQTLMLNANKNKDETACEHTSVSSDVGTEQVEQGTTHCETNNGEHGGNLSLVEKCGPKTDTTKNSQHHVSSKSHDTQCTTQKITQDIEVKNTNKSIVEHTNITVPLDLEIRLEQVKIADNQVSRIDQHASLLLQQIPMKEENSSIEQVEQDANLVIDQVAEQQLTMTSMGSPQTAEQTSTSAKENTTLEESSVSPQQPGNVTKANFLMQTDQEPYVEECRAESKGEIVPGSD
ncbi:uncharacterized protein LOC115469853 [Microcaecilia unicolor]|uniref:Uncharacterized protein LOC115469853 n=1 Tax=Microcaecilia unicolor TaxID=1415580 RepID=A0A6P7Y5P6_9AMPH|nr:uncharacterized protein LOC115469853 [Microcaecilia unicolor]